MKIGSPRAMRQEPPLHDWKYEQESNKAEDMEAHYCNRCGISKPSNQIYAGGNCWSCNRPTVFKKRSVCEHPIIEPQSGWEPRISKQSRHGEAKLK